MPPARTGHSARLAGPLAAASRQTQTVASAAAAATANQRSASWIALATSGSERTRKTLSVQLSQQRRVEEGIAEQRAAERGEGSLEVDGDDECARTLRAQRAGRGGEDEVEEEGKREAGGERAEAQDERRPALPAGPERREPEIACKQCQVADPSAAPGERRDDAGRHERKTGDDGESGGELGLPGVGRELARSARDGERAEAVGERALRRRRAERGPPEGRGPAPPRRLSHGSAGPHRCWPQSESRVSHDVPARPPVPSSRSSLKGVGRWPG